MKKLQDLTDKNINDIYSIIVEKESKAMSIEWVDEKDFVLAKFREDVWDVNDNYDKTETGIYIDSDFNVCSYTTYVKKHPNITHNGNSYNKLYNHHKITLYLMSEGFDIGQNVADAFSL